MRRPVWDGRRSVVVMATPGVRDRMRQDLRTAMKARDRVTVGVLRATLGAIANAEAVPSDARPNVPGRHEPTEVPRRELGEADVAAVIEREIAEMEADARIHREHAAAGPQADLEARIAILTAYLDRPGPTRRAVTAP
jgi:uncharacterized protein YqeY